jgi:hypothetical protein
VPLPRINPNAGTLFSNVHANPWGGHRALLRQNHAFRQRGPLSGWILYETWLRYVGNSNIALHKPLGTPPATIQGADALNPGFTGGPTVLTIPYSQGAVPTDAVQAPTAANSSVMLIGRAMRAGAQISPPSLVMVGGVRAELVHVDFQVKIVANVGIPVYAARWEILYVLPRNSTAAIPVPTNPLIPST